MQKTALFATHLAADADVQVFGDWMLAAAYPTGTDAEAAAARVGVAIFDLAPVDALVLSGEEVRRWINGMFTNKYTDVEPGQGRRSVIVDDRGRVQGLVDWYCLAEDRFLGVLEGVDAAWFAQRFRMFMILDDIECDHLEDVALLSLQGPGADALVASLGLPCPVGDHSHRAVDPTAPDDATVRICRKDRTGLGGLDLLVPRGVLDATWAAAVAAGATPAGQHALDALRIVAGRAAWPQDGTEKSMVHELGYNIDSVSFDKGCYLGQEVINRIERRGGVRKRLTRIALDDDALPPVGAEVLLGEHVVGTVTSAARLDGRVWALGTLRESAWEPGTALRIRAGDRVVEAKLSPADSPPSS